MWGEHTGYYGGGGGSELFDQTFLSKSGELWMKHATYQVQKRDQNIII